MKVFIDLLRNINKISKKEEKIKQIQYFKDVSKKIKRKYFFRKNEKLFFKKKSIFAKETYLNDSYSNLEISYLKKKQK